MIVRALFFKPWHAAVEAGSALPLDGGVKCLEDEKMRIIDLLETFVNSGPFWQDRHGVCSLWKSYPPKPAVYLLTVSEPFRWGHEETDIIYIGCTKHLGGIDMNCRLWDYHTRVTQHEQEIVAHVTALDAKGDPVKIYWCYVEDSTHRSSENLLLTNFRNDHGRLPMLNKRG
ncbi:hypothetical protein ES703_54867 [subsurface metagenome]